VGAKGPFWESLLFKATVVVALKLLVIPMAARGIKVCVASPMQRNACSHLSHYFVPNGVQTSPHHHLLKCSVLFWTVCVSLDDTPSRYANLQRLFSEALGTRRKAPSCWVRMRNLWTRYACHTVKCVKLVTVTEAPPVRSSNALTVDCCVCMPLHAPALHHMPCLHPAVLYSIVLA
jgi:hypothetical protein